MEIKTIDNKDSLTINPGVFDYSYNEGLIHQVVVAFMNKGRSGNSAQKSRAEVRGGGKKPWRQKGTGRARAGTIRSPIWRAGGVTFASKKRDYAQKINKKMYKRAICSILSELCRKACLVVVSDFQCESHKTKDFLQKMQTFNLNSALIVLPEINEQVYLASRNLVQYELCDVISLDPVSLLRFEHVMFTTASLKHLEEKLQ